MALLNPSFLGALVVVCYLSTFVIFAILRIVTGISIQRIGYFSLRRLAYTLKDGIKIEIRGLGLNLHRPTFAQPTWLSIVLTELAITVDLSVADGGKPRRSKEVDSELLEKPRRDATANKSAPTPKPSSSHASFNHRSKSWRQLMRLKERIKRLHRNINWIRMVDIVAANTTINVTDVGNIQIGSFTMVVDTRKKMVDRGRMFSHIKTIMKEQRPAEWMIAIRSVLFTPDGRESLEVLDHATLNIHGLLYKELDGLRDAAIALKLGRLHIPYDDIRMCLDRFKHCQKQAKPIAPPFVPEEISVADLIEELDRPGSREERLVQTVSDSKEFASSILRGVKEVQFAVSFVGFSKKIVSVQPHGTPIYLNASMKEVGVDLHRLDHKSAAHRMYFAPKDIAHQALVAALAISVGVDDGGGKSDRLLYIPMATTTVRTTLPSKTVEFASDNSADERNANMLFANVVITSPSVDLDPKHLPLVLAVMRPSPRLHKVHSGHKRRALISRLLPKANVKFSMHEPVVRIALPPVESSAQEDDFDLIVASVSSISLDIESSHSAVGELHYALGSTLRVQSYELYYQTSSGSRFDLLHAESLDLKLQVSANPEVYVVATGNLQTFSVHMIRPEISEGVRQIVRQLRINVEPEKKPYAKSSKDMNFIRAMPAWLLHFQLQGSDFSAEVAGVDEDISEDTRGVAVQLESWTAEYRAQKAVSSERKPSRRRAGSRSLSTDPEVFLAMPQSPRKKYQQHPTDGRRLAVHIRGLEAFVVESAEKWEVEPFLAVPRFEVALSTSSDAQGAVFHVNSTVRTLLVQYSLYRHYACGVATTVLQKAFVRTKADQAEAEQARHSFQDAKVDRLAPPSHTPDDARLKELITLDFRSSLVQVKAQMPSDPPLMLQIYGMDVGRHRWSSPFLHAKLVRVYAEAPKIPHVWARILSIKALRVDLRQHTRKHSSGEKHEERMVDVHTEAIRIAVPHQLVLHKVFDNCVNTMKAVEQLHHRFITGTNEYILEKHPEGPKRLPKISVRSKALLFELEDGAFEWKLGTIYRTGLVEQQQRLARDAAFKVKVKKIEEEEMRKDTRYRNRSSHPRGRSTNHDSSRQRERRAETPVDTRSTSPRGRRMRYDPDGTCGLSGTAKIGIKEAHKRLQHHNSQSWKKRIDRIYSLEKSGMKDLRSTFWGPDDLPDDMEEIENILEVAQRPGLMATLISDLHITLDKPSFHMQHLPDFLHQVGKGMPRDMKYSLLVPMNVQIDMGEARVILRDYPLPLLHVPAIANGQSPKLPAWSLKTDFVVAEEFRGPESTRHVKVEIIPPKDSKPGTSNAGGFAIDVRRTVSAVKSYSDIQIAINTGLPTRITWGASYQPAIQDMMMVIETFTKPQVDPSDRVGFWDKIRLSFHSRVSVAWKGDGDVHLMLKGTRDPYSVTGNGAGFLMCWRNDVRWNICREEDPRKFITVDSGEYILAIPDYSHQARSNEMHADDDESSVSTDNFKRGATFKKVVMKLSGNVQWLAGLRFERDLDQPGKRSFEFEPHYKVIMKEPQYSKAPPGLVYDAFRGFRSQHIHMSIAVKGPVDREWTVSNTTKSSSYNTVHLTPRFFSHFFAWWSMFGGTMSLPVRQGALWPGIEKSSKKFGRHLATIKYNVLLAPLFISHIYKHKDPEDYSEDIVSATGLKIRLDSFMLDIHQRREEFLTQVKGRKTQTKTTGLKMHRAQLDLLSADIRAVSASIAGTTSDDLRRASVPTQQETGSVDLSNFEIPDQDYSWIDMDDFVELDWILPSESNPETKIMPLAFAPRFTYFRQTDRGDSIAGDPNRTSPFGNEPTHFCIMSEDDDPRRMQCQLIQSRLDQLEKQTEAHHQLLEDAEATYSEDEDNQATKSVYDQLSRHGTLLRDKRLFLESMLHRMAVRIDNQDSRAIPDEDESSHGENPDPQRRYGTDTEGMDTNPSSEFISDFNNRFVIHNMQMKWNNLLRNIILRYIHQVGQRRGFVYYLSRRAVKFILDIVEEQNKAKTSKSNTPPTSKGSSSSPSPPVPKKSEEQGGVIIEDRIHQLLADGKKFVSADDPHGQVPVERVSTEQLNADIGDDFTPQNSYHLRLIAPQIQLQSEKNPKAVVLVTAKGMELKVVEVMDKDRIYDDVSGLVQRRFAVEMDSTQFFVTQKKWFSSQLLSLYSGSYYGTPVGSAWPPWVPVEVIFDFQADPFGFKRVVQKTSASLRYDKYNTLRLKYNEDINSEGSDASQQPNVASRMDHLWVEFPKIRALCNSSQYYAMYIIVLDLLMYSEPLEKTRTERLEKIMLASDFSDLRGAPEMVIRLQERIQQLEEIKTQFQIHSNSLDKQGWEDRLSLDKDLTACEDELFFLMKAITTSQRKYEGSQSSGLLRWNISTDQIVWHLIQDNNEPLMEFQIQMAEYDRTDNSDGSHINLMTIGKIVGLNLRPDAIYPEMFAPYSDLERGTFHGGGEHQMLRVYWYMLEAIAGIPVMDHFEVNLFPMKIQLEHEVAKRLFEYMFPGHDEKSGESKTKSPFMVKNMLPTEDEDEDEELEGEKPWSQDNTSGAAEPRHSTSSARAGSLELRLQPTMNTTSRPATAISQKTKASSTHGEGHHFKLFGSKTGAVLKGGPSARTPIRRGSFDSQQSANTKPSLGRSSTATSNGDASSTDLKNKRFGMHRSTKSKDRKKPSDDLTQMMSRASNYMTLAYVKIPSVVLCLSYKGKGERNLEDVHDFVFRLPMIEYRNKTWSNLDLALALKKDVIRALISHTGAIIGNKFSKHRPTNAQQSRLRELANSSVVLTPPNNDMSFEDSESHSPTDTKPARSVRSVASSSHSNGNGLDRPKSARSASSIRSGQSSERPKTSHAVPSSLMMTNSSHPYDEGGMGSRNGNGEHEHRHGGLLANTLHRLIPKKDRDTAEEGEDASKRKARSILGKRS